MGFFISLLVFLYHFIYLLCEEYYFLSIFPRLFLNLTTETIYSSLKTRIGSIRQIRVWPKKKWISNLGVDRGRARGRGPRSSTNRSKLSARNLQTALVLVKTRPHCPHSTDCLCLRYVSAVRPISTFTSFDSRWLQTLPKRYSNT